MRALKATVFHQINDRLPLLSPNNYCDIVRYSPTKWGSHGVPLFMPDELSSRTRLFMTTRLDTITAAVSVSVLNIMQYLSWEHHFITCDTVTKSILICRPGALDHSNVHNRSQSVKPGWQKVNLPGHNLPPPLAALHLCIFGPKGAIQIRY